MCQLLTFLLREKGPNVPFDEAYIIAYKGASLLGWPDPFYVVGIEPSGLLRRWWKEFERMFPDWERCAIKQDAVLDRSPRIWGPRQVATMGFCPIFRTKHQLVVWLCQVLQLSGSVYQLLLLHCPVVRRIF